VKQTNTVKNKPIREKREIKTRRGRRRRKRGTGVSIPDDRSGVDRAGQEPIATLAPLQRKDRTYHDDETLKKLQNKRFTINTKARKRSALVVVELLDELALEVPDPRDAIVTTSRQSSPHAVPI